MARKKSRIPAVVPRIVFSTVFVGVVPAVAAQACNSGTTTSGPDSSLQYGVAYQCFDASDPNCHQYGVAAVAFQCFDGSTQPGCPSGVADAAFGDSGLDADGAG